MTNLPNIEGIYPLAPLQKGLLFSSLYSSGSGAYTQQSRMTISGPLDVEAMRKAWEKIVQRHSSLRTSFMWEHQEHPVQIVRRRVKLPWEMLDWRDLSAEERAQRFDHFLRTDRRKGFDFARAPLLRITLVRTADQTYELVATSHHIILDGWSNYIVINELTSLLQPERHSTENGLAKAAPPYREYIQWIQQQNAALAESFWRKELRNISETAYVPEMQPGSSHNDASSQQSCGARLESEVKVQLQELAINCNTTLSTLLAGAWGLLLHCCNNRQDVVFGLTLSGRPSSLPEAQDIVGLFINTLPLRVAADPEMLLSDWLQELQSRILDLQDYSYSDLIDVQRWSEMAPGQPLFESIFVSDNYPRGHAANKNEGPLSFREIHSIDNGNFPLAIVVVSDEGLKVGMTYDSVRLQASSANRLLARYCGILKKLPDLSRRQLWEVTALSDDERVQLLSENNRTHCDYGHPTCLHELFELQAVTSPEAIALSLEKKKWTYREVNESANRLAHYLLIKGIRPEDRVGVHFESSAQTVLAALAVLKAGAVYLPLDSAYPQQVLHHMILDAEIQVVLTESKLSVNLPQNVAEIVDLAAEEKAIQAQPCCNCDSGVSLDNLAYVIYTSGSTGLPKGVAVTHRNAFNTIQWTIHAISINSLDKILLGVSTSFDPSIAQMFSALCSGAELVCMKAGAPDASHILSIIEEKCLTLIDLSPSMLAFLFTEGQPQQFRSVKRILTGGEAVPASILPLLFSKLPAPFFNLYGPTETCINASYWTCTTTTVVANVPIGRPIANAQLYILDRYLQPVPVGVPGEIFIGGIGVSRGYLNRPDLTAERFIPDPYASQQGSRLYRTGDLARFLNDGNIEFLGRTDSQVKIRGLRIELGQVEAALKKHLDVHEAAAAVRVNKNNEPLLVAYVGAYQSISERELKTFLQANLPGYMVPSVVVFLDQFPRLPNGKINQKLLPAIDFELIANSQKAPRNEWEGVLATIWASVLRLDTVGADDNFFALGGHSLLAMRIISKIHEAFGVQVPVRLVFEKPTIRELCAGIQALTQNEANGSIAPLLSRVQGNRAPMSFSQQRLWFLDRLNPSDPFYNLPEALRFHGLLHIEALKRALAAISKRHSVLRTTYAEEDGKLVQVISEDSIAELSFIDLTDLSPDERHFEAKLAAEQEAGLPFDLEQGPVFRAKLLKLDQEEHVLLMTFHHIAADGWSAGIVERELSILYRAFCEDIPNPLQEFQLQYADFAAWEQERFNGPLLDQKLAYWRNQLAGASGKLELMTDLPRPATQSFRGNSCEFRVPMETARLLKRLGLQESSTSFMTLLAAFNTLLYRYSGQIDILVGFPVSGRDFPELEKLVGLFVNTVVLRTDLSGPPSFRELVRRVRSATISAYSNQEVPFEKIIETINPARDLSRSPLFQVMFSFQQDGAKQALDFGNLQATPFAIEAGTSKFDLELLLTETADGLDGILEYNIDLFLPKTIEGMVRHFCNLLRRVGENPDDQVSQFPLLDDSERQQIIYRSCPGPRAQMPQLCFHQVFEAQAQATPDNLAVTAEDGSLTYRELNERSNSLAHALTAKRSSPESVIAVLADRGSVLLCCMMGIWKAGCVYLPLDPRYPPRRLAEMVEQSCAEIILVTPLWRELLNSMVAELHTPVSLTILDAEMLSNKPSIENPVSISAPENLAYVIFTSGSTGKPKGAMVEHRGMLNHLLAKIGDLDLTGEDSVAQTASQCFDISIWQFLAALMVGGCTHVCSNEVAYNPACLLDEIEKAQLSILETVPSLLQLVLDEIGTTSQQFSLSSLRWLIPTGEALSPDLVRRWLERYPAIPMLNAYGPTECSDDITHCLIDTALPESVLSVSIGKPLRNMSVYVLDEDMQVVPVGVPGELFVSGVGVGRGYINNPETTALSFCPDSISGDPGARLYRTGDRGRFLRNGKLEFLGRVDQQVKIRGFRVELGETEFRLRQHPGVRACAVMDRKDSSGNTQLVAYVVLDQQRAASPEDLRNFLKASLPDYMVPSLILFLEALPLLPSGKLDRKALPQPDLTLISRPPAVPPQTEIERRLVRIWETLLQTSPIGVNDNFFDLGGHSILALRLMGEIQSKFGRKLQLTTLFQHGTVRELAEMLEATFSPSSASPVITMQPVGSNPALFFVHVGSGEVLCYLDLVRHLGKQQPFYGVQDPNLYSDVIVDMSIEERATMYLEAIRALQPAGPYFLGGWSFGGLVAFEMARQLQNCAEEVALLALFDTGSPDFVRQIDGEDDEAALLGIIGRELNLGIKDAELRSLSLDEKFQFLAALMKDAGIRGGDPINFLARQLAIFKSRNRAIRRYYPTPYDGVITFFRASEEYFEDPSALPDIAREPARGFAALTTRPIDLHMIPGSHHQMAREPQVRVLAGALSNCVEKALQASRLHEFENLREAGVSAR